MPRGRTTQKRQQHGGVKFSRNLKKHIVSHLIGINLLEENQRIIDLTIIETLVTSATHIELVSDTSTY